jgi:3-methylcrotonyl-CoA carboxylase alpha subunit
MFASVLIANRGEIAVRIARTARRLGLRTIAVYSQADAGALHVRLADEAHLIGPAPAAESYLAAGRLIDVAKRAGAACIHPGYGFLAENPEFAEACAAAGIVFIGPPPAAIRAMGLKDAAKALMEKAGVPVVPGYHGARQEPKFLREKAYEIGYPVLVKAVAGGGGKGMRRVDKHAEFEAALAGAMREAKSAFGDDRVLVEKYIASPRHIEIQVFGDARGNVIHLNERDCSLQRRHQKVIEEAPAPGMSLGLRAAMGQAAVAAAKAVGYVGAGTVEFIAEASKGLAADRFWFMEMNTRLQVEHPVTEAVTGLDLVEWQFRVASGEPLPLAQGDVPLAGHAVEARLYAEDPEKGFLPSTGRLVALDFPSGEGIRVDAGVTAGSDVTPYYDPMIAKLIAHGRNRAEALDRLASALDRTRVAGPRTNLAFLAALVKSDGFRGEQFDTGFIERNLAALKAVPLRPCGGGLRGRASPCPRAGAHCRAFGLGRRIAVGRDGRVPARRRPGRGAAGAGRWGKRERGLELRRERHQSRDRRRRSRGRRAGGRGGRRRLRPARRPADRGAAQGLRGDRCRAPRHRRAHHRAHARQGAGHPGRARRRRRQGRARRLDRGDEDGACAHRADRRHGRRGRGRRRQPGRRGREGDGDRSQGLIVRA